MDLAEFESAVAFGESRSICPPGDIDSIIALVQKLKDIPGDIVEVGAYRGGSAIVLAASSLFYCDPPKRVFAFDTFGGMPETTAHDQHKRGEFGDVDFEEVKKACSGFGNLELVRGLHEQTIPAFLPRPLAIVFMDSDLFESHRVALRHFWPCVSPGGTVLFHDWERPDCQGVKVAVDEFFGPPTRHSEEFYGFEHELRYFGHMRVVTKPPRGFSPTGNLP